MFIDTFRIFAERKWKEGHHGAVDESSSEQQSRKSDAIIFAVLKIWSHTPSASGSYGRQAVRQNTGRFGNI